MNHARTTTPLAVRTPVRNWSRATARASSRGFSLLEIMLVIVIIGLIIGVASVSLLGTADRAKVNTTKTSMSTIKANITSYMVENGTPPETLQTLVDAGFLEGVGSAKQAPRDAWDMEFYYKPIEDSAGNPFTLISTGKDKQANTADDINVWTMDDD